MMVTNFALIVLLLWAGSVPVVIPKHYRHMNRKFWGQSVCNKYALPVNTMWTLRASCEDTKRFQCQPGYQSRVQTTCRNGIWYTEPTCQAVICPSGEIINNSDNVTKSRIFGEDFTFDCKAGYKSDNGMTGTMTCDKRGNWIDKTICEVMRCPSGANITYQENNETFVRNDYFIMSVSLNQKLYKNMTDAECTELCNNNVSCGFPLVIGSDCLLLSQPIIFLSARYNATACFDKCTELIECVTMILFNKICVLVDVDTSMLPATFKFKFQPNSDGRVAEKICN